MHEYRTTYWVVEDWRSGRWHRHPSQYPDREAAVRAAERCVRDLHERQPGPFGVRALKLQQLEEQSWSYQYDGHEGAGL